MPPQQLTLAPGASYAALAKTCKPHLLPQLLQARSKSKAPAHQSCTTYPRQTVFPVAVQRRRRQQPPQTLDHCLPAAKAMSRQQLQSNWRLTPRQGLPCRCCCGGASARWQRVPGQGSHVCAVLQQRRGRHSAMQCSSALAHNVPHCLFSLQRDHQTVLAGAVFLSITGKQDAGVKLSS